MSTRSNIGIVEKDGTVREVYCHFDGYPAHNGKLLLEHYTVESKVRQLVELGSLSVLAEEIGEKHDFDSRDEKYEKWCRFYGRDRNETDVGPTTHASREAAIESMQEYLYLFVDGAWIYSDHGSPFKPLTKYSVGE